MVANGHENYQNKFPRLVVEILMLFHEGVIDEIEDEFTELPLSIYQILCHKSVIVDNLPFFEDHAQMSQTVTEERVVFFGLQELSLFCIDRIIPL